MDLYEMGVEGMSLAVEDGRRQQRRVRVDDGEGKVPLEMALGRSIPHEAGTYFAILAGQM